MHWIGRIGSDRVLVSHARVHARVHGSVDESTRVSVRRVSGHLHAKRGRRCDGERYTRVRKRERERRRGKKRVKESASREDAFARPEVVRICTSCARIARPKQYVACEVTFFPGTTLRPCTYSWSRRFANWWPFVCALRCERPVGKPKQFQRNDGWKVPGSVRALTSSLDRDAGALFLQGRFANGVV